MELLLEGKLITMPFMSLLTPRPNGRRLAGACLLAGLLTACLPEAAPGPGPAPAGEAAQVVRVIDGDTIDVDLAGRTERVRYIGVNTPERDQACYREATLANAALVEGQTVTLVKDVSETDRNGRLLRYVYVGEVLINAELVKAGYAEAKRFPPDTAQAEVLEALEAEARAADRACHATGVFGNPQGGAAYTCADGAGCIKGNINQQGERYYHFPGCGSYAKTGINEDNGERYFATSLEAEAAGWRRAPDCP